MNIAIVTANFGQRDTFSDPSVIFPSADYYAFSDKPKHSNVWKCIIGEEFSLDTKYAARRNAKIYKILPELFIPGYDFYIWVDSTHDVIYDPELICEFMGENSFFSFFRHRDRNCVYKEAEEVKRYNLDHANLVDEQMKMYRNDNFPEEWGLMELPAFVKYAPLTKEFSLMWWEHICKYSSRDQLSLPYLLWKTGMKYDILPGLANGWDVPNLQSKYIRQVRAKRGS